jgi:Ni,Fe-hydrogenase III large subunit
MQVFHQLGSMTSRRNVVGQNVVGGVRAFVVLDPDLVDNSKG